MAMAMAIDNYSKTQRIVLVIDLTPLLHYQNPNHYITTLLSTTKTLLSFPPFSNSLFSFKLFFSSLSPFLSSSKLPFRSSFSLSFNHPIPTLHSLTSLLSSLSTTINKSSIPSLSPRALHVASSLRELIHDYAWEPLIPGNNYDSNDDDLVMCVDNCDNFWDSVVVIKSNLVVLFSPILKSFNWLSGFLDVGVSDECLRDVNAFNERFCRVFNGVNDAFVSRDIHFSWVDVKCGIESDVGFGGFEEVGFGFFESGIKGLGWGFCSSDAIVLGSALVPFGLIYPRIGISSKFIDFNRNDSYETIRSQLSLEILDVSGNPLECKCCDLELVNMNLVSRIASNVMDSQMGCCERKKRFWESFGNGIAKVHVKAVQLYHKCENFEGSLLDPILVCEFSGDCEKDQKGSCSAYFEDRVLEILASEMGDLVPRKSVPIWQILLSFLYREGYWALVSLSNGNSDSFTGILKPFTVSSALLSVIGDEFQPSHMTSEFSGSNLHQFVANVGSENRKLKIDLKHTHGPTGCQSGCPTSEKQAELGGSKRKKNKKNISMLRELKWSDFCKAALEQFQIDLEEVYLARECNKSKKLKFLKCWMKQIRKSSSCSLTIPDRSKTQQDFPREADSRITDFPQESEQPIASCASVGEDSLTGASRIQDEVAIDFRSETMESFFSDLPNKIQQGVESEEVDLGSLAQRLVNSSIYWLYQKCEKETAKECQIPVLKSNDPSAGIVIVELAKLLLREPKDMAAMYRNSDPSLQASNLSSTEITSENIVRQYELQILFRMEILQSEVGASIGESMKQKFVKQICLLLETIQCHLKGGFFGDWSLDRYVGKIIKSRYCESLGDVVDKIYAKMDLLLFTDEDESPNPLLNSEDSSQSWKERLERDGVEENYRINDPISAHKSLRQEESKYQSIQGMDQEEHARKLIEARERRHRARRFASFTSWVPDLQRVWAPKQAKAMKPKSDPLRKLSKRKEQRRASFDMVCETPLTEKKQSCIGRNSSVDDKDHQDFGTPICGSVYKALFQDD